MLVRTAILPNPLIVPPEASLVEFIQSVLATNQTTGVVVGEDGRLQGVVSVHDIFRHIVPHYVDDRLARVVTQGYFEERFARFARTRVDEIMVVDVDTIGPDDDIVQAAARFVRAGRKMLPVVDGDRFVGIVTRRSILRKVTDTAMEGQG